MDKTPLNPPHRPRIKASRALYIKLGAAGKWERECIEGGTLHIGFNDIPHALCRQAAWDAVTARYRESGVKPGPASDFTRQLQDFYGADENTLWVTFFGRKLYYGFAEGPVEELPVGGKVRKIRGGWRCADISGKDLDISTLSSRLTQVAGYRGTLCAVKEFEYLMLKINGARTHAVEHAEGARASLRDALVPLIQHLTWHDFEVLVDLIFTAGGWRRTGVLGKTEKAVDLELLQPVTGERVMVQVKSRCDAGVLREISESVSNLRQFSRVFVAMHTGNPQLPKGLDKRLEVLDGPNLAALALDAGLTDWLIQKSA